MTSQTITFALYLAIAVLPSVAVHEYAEARAAGRLGDPSPRRWGRLTLDPRPHIDRFGTVVLPALLLLLIAVGVPAIPFAYAKPLPLEPSYLRRPDRDDVLVALAGPFANLAVAAVAGILVRFLGGEAQRFVIAVLYFNAILFVFNLLPIPGLDGARILARYLHGRAKEVYVDFAQYLPLVLIVVFFVFGGPILGIVNIVAGSLCTSLSAGRC
ncbi:MAG: site-2 protease family protein [Actinomycetota bacterium]